MLIQIPSWDYTKNLNLSFSKCNAQLLATKYTFSVLLSHTGLALSETQQQFVCQPDTWMVRWRFCCCHCKYRWANYSRWLYWSNCVYWRYFTDLWDLQAREVWRMFWLLSRFQIYHLPLQCCTLWLWCWQGVAWHHFHFLLMATMTVKTVVFFFLFVQARD